MVVDDVPQNLIFLDLELFKAAFELIGSGEVLLSDFLDLVERLEGEHQEIEELLYV